MPELDIAEVVRGFVTLFAATNPIGSIPNFRLATKYASRQLHWRYALRAVMIAGIALLGCIISGPPLLEALGLSPNSVQLVAETLLFLFSVNMILGRLQVDPLIANADRKRSPSPILPMAFPSIASPGAIVTVVILTYSESTTFTGQTLAVGVLAGVSLLTFALFLLAAGIHRMAGFTGCSVISQVMGVVLAMIAVDTVLSSLTKPNELILDSASVYSSGSGTQTQQ